MHFFPWLRGIDLIKLAIALSVISCFDLIVYALIFKEIPEGNREILIHTLGIIEGVVTTIAAYYWGSSHGSKQKTDAMTKMIKGEVDKDEESAGI